MASESSWLLALSLQNKWVEGSAYCLKWEPSEVHVRSQDRVSDRSGPFYPSVLTIQQVSTQAYFQPSALACRQVCKIFAKPPFFSANSGLFLRSWYDTSSWPQVCDRIAYGGAAPTPANSSSWKVSTLISHIYLGCGRSSCPSSSLLRIRYRCKSGTAMTYEISKAIRASGREPL